MHSRLLKYEYTFNFNLTHTPLEVRGKNLAAMDLNSTSNLFSNATTVATNATNGTDLDLDLDLGTAVTVSGAPTALVLAMLAAVVLMACQVYLMVRLGTAVATSEAIRREVKCGLYWAVLAFYLVFTVLAIFGITDLTRRAVNLNLEGQSPIEQSVTHPSFGVVWALLLLLAVVFVSGLIFHLIFGLEWACMSTFEVRRASFAGSEATRVKSEPPPSYDRVASEDLGLLPRYEDVVTANVSVAYV